MEERRVVSKSLSLALTEGFRELSEEEKGKLRYVGPGNARIFRDEQNHILLSFAWKKIPLFSAFILSNQDLAEQTEKTVSKAMREFGYACEGFVTHTLQRREAKGFRFGYVVQDTAMRGESLLCKKKSGICYLHAYWRQESAEKAEEIWKNVLESARWEG